MAKIFNKLKSIFVVQEVENEGEQNFKSNQDTISGSKIKFDISEGEGPARIDQKYLDILFKALEENNLEGYDYLEFKESLNSLKSVEMTEEMRYKSAIAMANSMDADIGHLLDSAMQYLSVLKHEENKFEKALENQVEKKIGSNQDSLVTLESLISTRQEEIEKLNSEIVKLEEQMNSKKRQLEEASIKLGQVKKDFRASYSYLTEEITKDIESLKKVDLT